MPRPATKKPKPVKRKSSRKPPPIKKKKKIKERTQAKKIDDLFSARRKSTGRKWYSMMHKGEISKSKLMFLLATGLAYILRSRLGRQQLWALFSYLTGCGKWAAFAQLASEIAVSDKKPPPDTIAGWGQDIAASARNHMIGVKTGAPLATFIHDTVGKVTRATLSVAEAAVDYAKYLSWTSQKDKLAILVETAVHASMDDPLLVSALKVDVFSSDFVSSILQDPRWNPRIVDESISQEWRRRLMILWQLVLAQVMTMQETSKTYELNKKTLKTLANHAQSLIDDLSKLE